MHRSSLRRNIGSAIVGNMAYTLSQFLMLWSVVRLTSEHRVGQYAFALALTAPIFIFAGLKMRHVQVTDARGVNRAGEYIAVRLTTSLAALMACAALAAIVTDSTDYRLLIISVAGFKAIEAQVDVLYGVMQRRERLDLVARSMLARAISGAVVFAAILSLTDSIAAAVAALSLLTVAFVLRESRIVRQLGASPFPEFTGRRLLTLVWLSLPLGLSVSVGSLTTNMPRYFLEALEGSASVGVFAAIAYVLVAVSLIGGSAAEAASPRMANLHNSRSTAAFKALTGRLALFGLTLGLCGTLAAWLVGEAVLTLLFGDAYGRHANVLVLLMIAATIQFSSLAVGAAIYAMRLFAIQVPINILGLAVSIVAGYPLIQQWGLSGAALTVIATQAALGGCYFFLYVRHIRQKLTGARIG